MKSFWRHAGPVILILSCSATTLLAETRYISDQLVVSLRDQPANGGTSITYLRTDTPVEILEEADGFVKVKTKDGETGYIKSNYLTTSTPKAVVIRQLEKERARLASKLAELEQQVTSAKTRNKQSNSEATELQKKLNSSQAELARVNKAYQSLQNDTKNVVAVTAERDQLRQANQELTTTVSQLEEEQNSLMTEGIIKWFLAGAGVLFFGWLIGRMSQSNRRRSLL